MVPCSPTCLPGFFCKYHPFFFEGYVLERSLLPRYLYFHMFQIIGAWSHVLLPAYLGFFTNTPVFFRRVRAGTSLATSLPLFSHVPINWCMVPCSPTCLPGFFHEYPHIFGWVRAGTSLATSLPLFSHVPNNWCMVPCSPTCLPGFFSRIPPVFFEGYVLESSLLPRYLYFHMFQIIGAW